MNLIHFIRRLLRGDASALITGPLALMVGPGSGDGFQSFVNTALPPGVLGDFAGANIRANIVAGSFGYTATPAGVLVGNGGWANPSTKLVSNYYQPNSAPGFVHREGQTVITNFLGISSLLLLGGMEVTIFSQETSGACSPARPRPARKSTSTRCTARCRATPAATVSPARSRRHPSRTRAS